MKISSSFRLFLIVALWNASLPLTAWSLARPPSGPEGGQTPPAWGGLLALAPWLFIFGIFYFLLIRPQQKQTRERKRMIDSLKRGDRILSSGGLYGVVTGLKGSVLEVKLSGDIKVEMDRNAVTQVNPQVADASRTQSAPAS